MEGVVVVVEGGVVVVEGVVEYCFVVVVFEKCYSRIPERRSAYIYSSFTIFL